MNHEKDNNQNNTENKKNLSLLAQNASLYLFDMGNVVIKNIHVLPQIIAQYKLPQDEFMEDYRKYDFPLMDGTISTPAYWDHIEEKFGIHVQGNPFAEYFKPYFNEPVVRVIEKLRKNGKRVVAASNTFAPHYDPLVRDGFTTIFDVFYASHLMKVSKPSRYFFDYIVKKEGVSHTDCFFVDDYAENIDAAQKIGLSCLWYADEGATDKNCCITADEKLANTFAFLG